MKHEKILIIDDDDELLGIYSKILSKEGYKVEVAADGLAGFNKVIEDKPNLILLDMVLPNMDGLEILKKIKSDPNLNDIYVLLITASPDVTKLLLKGSEAGADGYFMKGIPNTELVARVHAAFRHINTILSLKTRENELLVLNKTLIEGNEELNKLNKKLKESQTASLNLLSDLRDEIEERKEAQKAFIQSEKRFRDLISNVRLLSVTLDLEGNITFCNDYLLELTGWKYEEVIGKNWFKNFLPENISDEVLEIFQNSINTNGYPRHYVNEILTRNGEKRIIEWNNTTLRDSEGNIAGAASIGNDITELTESQNKIKKISNYYTTLIEKSSDGVAILDEESNFKYISPAGRKMFGYNDNEIIKGDPSSLTHPDDLQTVLTELDKLIQNPNYSPVLQYRFKDKNGSWIWIESTFTNLLSNPNVNGIVINFRNITEKKKAEIALHGEKDRLRSILDQVTIPIFLKDNDHRIIVANNAFLDMFSLDKKDVIGFTLAEAIPGNELKQFLAVDKRVLDEGVMDVREEELTVNNLTRTLITSKKYYTDFAGNKFLVGSIFDISDRKMIEEKLFESESKFRLVWEQTADGMRITNEKGIVILANPAYCLLMGKPFEEIIGQSISVVYESSKRKHILKQHQKLFSSRSIPQYLEKEITLWNGKRVFLELSNSFLEIENQPLLSLSVFRDITERKQAEEVQRKTSSNLNERVKELSCLYAISNLVQTPDISDDDFFQGVVDLIPSGFRYPKITICRLTINEKEYKTRNFKKTDWNICKDIIVNKSISGSIEVFQLKKLPSLDNEQFLNEEMTLLKAITEHLGRFIERMQAEAALQESEEKYRSIFENSALGIFRSTSEGRYEEVNKAFAKILGFNSPKNIVDEVKDISALYKSPKDREKIIKEFAEKGFVEDYVVLAQHPQKEQVWISINAKQHKHPDGTVYYEGTIKDITERKQAEKELRNSRDLLRIVIENIPVRVFWKDVNLNYLGCNRLFANDAGMSHSEELIGKDDFYMGWKDQAELYRSDDKLVMDSNKPKLIYEEPQTTPDGNTIWLQSSKVPLHDVKGKVIGILGIYEDITERKRIEEDLKKNEEELRIATVRYRKAQEIGHIGNWEYSIKEDTFWGSDEAKRIYGFDPDSDKFTTEEVEKLIPERDRVHQALVDLFELKKVYDIEFQINPLNSNEPKIVHSIAELVMDEENKPIKVVGVVQDVTQIKMAEIGLRESEEKFRTLFENSPDLIGLTDLKGNILDINRVAVGYNKEAVIGSNVTDYLTKKQKEEFISVVRKALNTGETCSYYPVITTPEGVDISWHNRVSLLRIEGEKDRLVINFTDITQQKLAEEALKESEEKYRLLHENAGLGIGYISPKGIVLSFNTIAAKDMNGVPEDFEGKSIFDLFPKAAADDYLKRLTKTVNSNKTLVFEDFVQLPDQKKWFLSTYTKIIDAKKNILGIQIISQDITERKKIEDVLRAEKLFSESLISNLPGVFYLINEDRKFLRWNTQFEEVTGLSAEEMATISPTDLFEGEDKQAISTAIKRVFSHGLVQVMAHIVTKNGKRIPYQFTGHKIIVDGANCLLGVGLDYTEREKAEEKIRRTNLILEEMSSIAKIGGWEIDLATMDSFFTTETFNIYGLKQSEVPSIEEGINYYDPESRPVIEEAVKNAIENQRPYNVEGKLIDATGTAKWVQTKGKVDDIGGKAKRLYGTLQDITEKKKIEEALRENEEFLRAIFDNSLNSILVADDSGNYIFVNKAAADMFGYSEKEMLKMNIGQLSTSKHENALDRYNKYIKSGMDVGEFEFIKPSGEPRIALYHAVRVRENFNLSILSDITQNKLTEIKIREANELNKSLLETIPFGFDIIDFEGNILFINQLLRDEVGARKVEGKCWDIYKDNKQECFDCILNKKLKLGDTSLCEVDNILGGREFEITYTVMKYKGTKALLRIFRDVTEEKLATKKMRQLTAGIEESISTVVITDTEGKIEYVNKSFETTTGYTREEAMGQNSRILKSGEMQKEFYEKLWETISSGKTFRGEMLNKRKNGTLYWEDAVISPIKDEQNNIINYLAIKADITEIKLLQDKLKKYNKDLEKRVDERTSQLAKSEENYRTLAESMNAYICSVDIDHKINYVNSALLLQLKKKPEEIIGNDLSNILELFNTKKNIKIANTAIKKGELAKIVAKAPWDKWIEWELDFVKKSQGKNYNFIILGHDITERIKIENKTKEALAKEKELGQLKSKFVSTVSHEFRTPLTSIYSSIELLERYGEKWVNEKKLNHFQRMKSSIERLTSMLEEMLLLGRAESSKTKYNPAYTNLNELCLSFIKETKPLLAKDQFLKYYFHLPELNYLVDQNLLRIILTNLISNSIKYSPNGEDISLDVSEEKDKIKFSITDSGMGISAKDIKNIFKPFYRTDNVSTISGSGLGLSIVKEYAKLHKGKIKVESELGQGSKFTLSISKITKILKED